MNLLHRCAETASLHPGRDSPAQAHSASRVQNDRVCVKSTEFRQCRLKQGRNSLLAWETNAGPAPSLGDLIYGPFRGRKQAEFEQPILTGDFLMSVTAIPAVSVPSPGAGSAAVAGPSGPETPPSSTPSSFNDSVASSSTPARQPSLAPVSPGVGRIVDLSA